ncbi:MAG TPA: pyrroline-5-carboxylate reductase [Clostridia bacterium]|nr:pyrroline-5-carboxylate reductase [Clostridia bacterium]
MAEHIKEKCNEKFIYRKEIGVIGFGTMGKALVESILRKDLVDKEDLIVADSSRERLDLAREELDISVTTSNVEAMMSSKTIVLSVKPQTMPDIMSELNGKVSPDQLIISIAAGITTHFIETSLGGKPRVVRAMPNLPCTVSEGMIAYSLGRYAQPRDALTAERLMGSVGKTIQVSETLMDAVTGLSGSGPAFLSLVMEAMADAGVKVGFDRKTALVLAAQTMLGTAKLALETGLHPAQIKDMVCSPGGTAITGIATLEAGCVRHHIMKAVEDATNRSSELGRQSQKYSFRRQRGKEQVDAETHSSTT